MNSKTAITILLLILSLSILTIMMIAVNRGMDRRAAQNIENFEKQTEQDKKIKSVVEKTDLEKELENKDYSMYPEPELEREKDQAKLRLEKLNALRGGSPGPSEEELSEMTVEEKAQLEDEAQARLDRLNELRAMSAE